jgi:hypothetical protein
MDLLAILIGGLTIITAVLMSVKRFKPQKMKIIKEE